MDASTTLVITTQPPAIFVNQQWGKRHGFRVVVQLKGIQMRSSLVLKTALSYADNNKKVPGNSRSCSRRRKYKMLQILDQRNFNEKGEAEIFCRINDVSRNHQGRKFCLDFSCVCGGKELAQCRTSAIKVISKRPKRKVVNDSVVSSADSLHIPQKIEVCPSKRRRTLPFQSKTFTKPSDWGRRDWMAKSFELLQHLQGQQVGFFDAAQTQPMYRCPFCHGSNDHSSKLPVHNADCVLATLLEQYQQPSTDVDPVQSADRIKGDSEYSNKIMSPDSIMDSCIGCDLSEDCDGMLLDSVLDVFDEVADDVQLNEDMRGVNGVVIDRFLSAPVGSENFFDWENL